MVTVVDPGGTPAPVYNRSGVTIQEVAAGGDNDFGSSTQIVTSSGWSIIRAQATDTPAVAQGIILPEGAEIGDMVEVYFKGYTGRVFPPSGETYDVNGGLTSLQCDTSFGYLFRKIDTTKWRFIAN